MGFITFPPAANRLSRDAFPPYRALLPDRSVDEKSVSRFPPWDRHHLASCCHAASCTPVPLPSRRYLRSPAPIVADRHHLPRARPQGLAPRSEPCPVIALPLQLGRCSPGLVPSSPRATRCRHRASHRHAGEGVEEEFVRQRPLRKKRLSVRTAGACLLQSLGSKLPLVLRIGNPITSLQNKQNDVTNSGFSLTR
jgi:hypothetical protein